MDISVCSLPSSSSDGRSEWTDSEVTATREEFDTYTQEIFGWIKEGKINVRIHKVYPLKDVRKAQEDIESRETTGKLILKI